MQDKLQYGDYRTTAAECGGAQGLFQDLDLDMSHSSHGFQVSFKQDQVKTTVIHGWTVKPVKHNMQLSVFMTSLHHICILP